MRMPAKNKLNDLLNGYGQETEVKEQPVLPETPVEEKTAADKVPPSRRGKRHISGYFEPEVFRQVKIICAENDLTVNEVLKDALNALFVNKGKPPIA